MLLTNLANLSSSFGETLGKMVQQEMQDADAYLKQDEVTDAVAMFESTLHHARDLGVHFVTWGQAIMNRAVAPLHKHNVSLGAVRHFVSLAVDFVLGLIGGIVYPCVPLSCFSGPALVFTRRRSGCAKRRRSNSRA